MDTFNEDTPQINEPVNDDGPRDGDQCSGDPKNCNCDACKRVINQRGQR